MIAATRVGRDGRLALGFERRGARTVVARSRYALPLQVLAPMALDDPAAVVSVLNPTGGLVGGDALEIEVDVGPGAHACVTTPSATKVYRAESAAATQEVSLRVAGGARLEWVPDHTIPFAGAAFRQVLRAEVGEGGALVVVDAFAAGRVARGEAWQFALLDSMLSIGDQGGLILHDRFILRHAAGHHRAQATHGPPGQSAVAPIGGPRGLGITEQRPYFATVVVVADAGVEAFAQRLDGGRASGAEIGVGLLARRGALVRCLAADAPALTHAVDTVWCTARREVLGLPPLALRKG